MTQLLTPETFEFFARYLLAGYIVLWTRSRFVTADRPKPTESLFEAVILSLVNQLIFQALLWAISGFASASPTVRALFFAEVLALPAILGTVLGLNLKRGWNRAWLRRLAMPAVHPIRRAHDFAFLERTECFVILTYEDGVVVRGFFGGDSLAATDAGRSDIYLERLYDAQGDEWAEPSPGRSGLFSLSGVRSIEFLDQEETKR